MNQGSRDIPAIRLGTLIGDMKILFDKFGTQKRTLTELAGELGHKSEASGTFKNKLASLRDYGLIEGRGKIGLTELGRRIVDQDSTIEEINDSLLMAIQKNTCLEFPF